MLEKILIALRLKKKPAPKIIQAAFTPPRSMPPAPAPSRYYSQQPRQWAPATPSRPASVPQRRLDDDTTAITGSPVGGSWSDPTDWGSRTVAGGAVAAAAVYASQRGGDFSGAGASGGWEAPSPCPSPSSYSSYSSDSGSCSSSDSGSSSSSSD